MINKIKNFIKETPLIVPFIFLKHKYSKKIFSQSNEAKIIDRLISRFDVPKRFIEFGFSGWEFNCIKIANEWEGLLIDGGAYNVTIAKIIFPKKVIAKKIWLTLDNMDYVINHFDKKQIGILSIDVDGNDYWFLKKLIVMNPAIIIIEFNVSFGTRPISVPYDPAFDRTIKHESWEYYGASISAMHYLCDQHNYSLVEVSQNGVNAFFVRNDLFGPDDRKMSVSEGYGRKVYPDGSLAPTLKFWDEIKHMPYVDVTINDLS